MLNASGSKLQDKANIRRIFASKSQLKLYFTWCMFNMLLLHIIINFGVFLSETKELKFLNLPTSVKHIILTT